MRSSARFVRSAAAAGHSLSTSFSRSGNITSKAPETIANGKHQNRIFMGSLLRQQNG
jgi:hypothetical protein